MRPLAVGLLLLGLAGSAQGQPASPAAQPSAQAAPLPGPPPGAPPASAMQPFHLPQVQLSLGADGGDWVGVLRILALMTVLTLAPGILLTMTGFTRIMVVMSILRQALGTQQSPPNQVLVALSLFMTVFLMQPVWSRIDQDALQPYMNHQISERAALERAVEPLRGFMFRQTRQKDLALFLSASGATRPHTTNDVSTFQLIPAFVISELKTAFQMGFMLYVPFLVLDMVVASLLMAMGMMMLPPVLISLPFKLMLFVLVDGWNLLVGSLVRSFQ